MKHTYITSNPKILGGEPVIAGTRVPVDTILYRLKEGHTLEEIHAMYRHISIDTLKKLTALFRKATKKSLLGKLTTLTGETKS